jgi:hypothetical protein
VTASVFDRVRSAARWLASTTGVSVGAASRSLQTARESDHPAPGCSSHPIPPTHPTIPTRPDVGVRDPRGRA